MSESRISLRYATSPGIDHIGSVIYPRASNKTHQDDSLHPHRAQHWKHYTRSCSLCTNYEVHSANHVIIVAATASAPASTISHSRVSKHDVSRSRIIRAATWEWISTSKPASVPASIQLPPRTLTCRPERMYYRSIFEIHHEYLDCSQDRNHMKAFRDEKLCPRIPFGNFSEEDAPQCLLLSDVSVLPEWQGRGVGSMLVRWGIERAREGVKGVGGRESDVHVDLQANPGTQAFWEKLGFEMYSKWEMDGMEWNEMILRPDRRDAAQGHTARTS